MIIYSKCWNIKLPTKNTLSGKYYFRNEGEIKAFLNKQKLKEVITLELPNKKG